MIKSKIHAYSKFANLLLLLSYVLAVSVLMPLLSVTIVNAVFKYVKVAVQAITVMLI
ncbi:hypothetical protein JCM18901_2381 [Psychrobacter sp. JCM 18901]|nr:hypothetical protein JCM18901_2381 [Psychrobacter sp. JCM 18901]